MIVTPNVIQIQTTTPTVPMIAIPTAPPTLTETLTTTSTSTLI
jgi:hypothetical protein